MEAFAGTSSLRSRTGGESILKGLVKGARSGLSNASYKVSLLLRCVSNSCSGARGGLSTKKRMVNCVAEGQSGHIYAGMGLLDSAFVQEVCKDFVCSALGVYFRRNFFDEVS